MRRPEEVESENDEVNTPYPKKPELTTEATAPQAESLRKQIADQGWITGCEVLAPLRDTVHWRTRTSPLTETDIVLICSHPCDILCYDFDREPSVEVIIARPIAKPQHDKQFARNPRTLHVQTATRRTLELTVSDRGDLDRRLLATQPPGFRVLLAPDTGILLDWLARRYFRSAFPDEFIRRLKPRLEKMRRLQEKAGDKLAGIWMRVLNNEELAPNIEYEILLVTVVSSRNVKDMEELAKFEREVHMPLVQSIAAVTGITLSAVRCVTDTTFNLQDIRYLDEFDVDHDLRYRLRQDGSDYP